MIAGVQKAGSTALAHFLRQHPRVYMPDHELHFFDRDDRDWSTPNRRAYHRNFRAAGRGMVLGEKTPIYTFWDGALSRIRTYNPNIRLIISLRSPVQRAFSHWRMERARGHEKLTFSQAIREGRKRLGDGEFAERNRRTFTYVERGYYAPQIRRALSLFDSEQVLFLTSEQLKNSHRLQLDRICDFLTLPRFAEYPLAKNIKPRLKLHSDLENRKPNETEQLQEGDRAYLLDVFRDDILETQDLTGLQISHWLEGRDR